jgi:hypothetical protein
VNSLRIRVEIDVPGRALTGVDNESFVSKGWQSRSLLRSRTARKGSSLATKHGLGTRWWRQMEGESKTAYQSKLDISIVCLNGNRPVARVVERESGPRCEL